MNSFDLRDIEIWSKTLNRVSFKTPATRAGVEPVKRAEEGSVRLNATATCPDGTQVTIAVVFGRADALALHDRIMKNLLGDVKSRVTIIRPILASSVEAWVDGKRQIEAGRAEFQMEANPDRWRVIGPHPFAKEGQDVWSLGFSFDDANARVLAELLRITPFQAPGR